MNCILKISAYSSSKASTCMYIYSEYSMHIYIHTYIRIYTYVRTYMHHAYIHTYVCMYVCTYVYRVYMYRQCKIL